MTSMGGGSDHSTQPCACLVKVAGIYMPRKLRACLPGLAAATVAVASRSPAALRPRHGCAAALSARGAASSAGNLAVLLRSRRSGACIARARFGEAASRAGPATVLVCCHVLWESTVM